MSFEKEVQEPLLPSSSPVASLARQESHFLHIGSRRWQIPSFLVSVRTAKIVRFAAFAYIFYILLLAPKSSEKTQTGTHAVLSDEEQAIKGYWDAIVVKGGSEAVTSSFTASDLHSAHHGHKEHHHEKHEHHHGKHGHDDHGKHDHEHHGHHPHRPHKSPGKSRYVPPKVAEKIYLSVPTNDSARE